jgi:mono/diheme cytochrome c family protein
MMGVGNHVRGRIVLAIAVWGLAFAAAVPASDEIDQVLIENGKHRYEQFCTACHGAGGAPGKGAKSDLRTYVARNGGKFPAGDWLAIITDSRPGSVHAEVWEDIHKSQEGSNADIAARGIIGQIARYVNSIQKP